jgi:hypothetical protein
LGSGFSTSKWSNLLDESIKKFSTTNDISSGSLGLLVCNSLPACDGIEVLLGSGGESLLGGLGGFSSTDDGGLPCIGGDLGGLGVWCLILTNVLPLCVECAEDPAGAPEVGLSLSSGGLLGSSDEWISVCGACTGESGLGSGGGVLGVKICTSGVHVLDQRMHLLCTGEGRCTVGAPSVLISSSSVCIDTVAISSTGTGGFPAKYTLDLRLDLKLLPGEICAESCGELGGSTSLIEGIVGFLVSVSETSSSDWTGTGGCSDTLEGGGQWNETSVGILLESQDCASLGSSTQAVSDGVVAVGWPCPGTGGGSLCSFGHHTLGVT